MNTDKNKKNDNLVQNNELSDDQLQQVTGGTYQNPFGKKPNPNGGDTNGNDDDGINRHDANGWF